MMTYCVMPSSTACSKACSAYRARITTHMAVGAMGFVMTLSPHSNGRIRKTRRQNHPHSWQAYGSSKIRTGSRWWRARTAATVSAVEDSLFCRSAATA